MRILACLAIASGLFAADLSPTEYLGYVKFLSSPEMKGRATGSPELDQAAAYIANQFQAMHLQPLDGKSFYQLQIEGNREPTTLLESQFANDLPRVSPDERWVAYQSNESGRWEIDLATFPTFADKRQISVNGGCQPIWRKDGKELFFLSLDGKLMAADVQAPHVGVPHALFQIPSTVVPVNVEYALSGDGKKFLLREPVDDNNDSIGVVLNWTAGLKR